MVKKRKSLFVVVTCLSCALAACTDNDNDGNEISIRIQRCTALREHLIGLRIRTDDPDAQQHRRALRDALGTQFVQTCADDYAADAIACALGARDSDGAHKCLVPADK